MFGRRITIFRVFGFAIRLDASWIIIAALVTWSLAVGVFPNAYPGLARGTYGWMGVVGALSFFGSIVIHELCHSLVASRYKLPMHGITLFVFGGVAEMGGEPESPKVEFLVAVAGPISSIVLGFIFYFLRRVLPSGPTEAAAIFSYLAWINWLLAGFNLIPAFPLDGGRLLRAALWHWKKDLVGATSLASRIGAGFGFVLMAFAVYQLFFGYLIGAVWYFLIGIFIGHASQTSYEQVFFRSVLAGETVRRFMRPNPIVVSSDLPIPAFVDDYLYRYDLPVYPVVEESERLVGCVAMSDVKAVPRGEWDQHRVGEVVKPCSDANTVEADTDAMKALSKMSAARARALFVTERNHLLGTVFARDILSFLRTKLRLEGRPMSFLPPPHPGS
jgi:Zn-dependent protease/CBS domain-containing protein